MSGPSKRPYMDAHELTLSPQSIVVVRTDTPWSHDQTTAFNKGLRDAFPEWQGLLVMLGVDQSLEMVPKDTAQALYRELRKIFGPKCHICAASATCVGRYETMTRDDFACDTCCGHAGEDGHCTRIVED